MYSENYLFNPYNIDYSYIAYDKPKTITNEIKSYFQNMRQNAKINKILEVDTKIEHIENNNIKTDDATNDEIKTDDVINDEIKIPTNSNVFYNMNILQISSIMVFSYIVYKIFI